MGRSYRRRDGNHREVSIKFDIRSVGIFDVVSARLGDGEVFDSAKLKNTVRFLIENDMRNVVIDLGNLEYLYSDTINAFIASNRHMLEVSGRIAILTEHPKVQDILKRAGLDNIMRIYRSEAEMIADSKEILRQTSSYRIEELQKISTQPQEAPPAPRTEFDDFKLEMGARLGSKLDNNEVPQYQLGLNQTPAPAAFGNPPAGRETAAPYPSFNAPGFNAPAAPEAVPAQGQPGYVPSQPAPAFGSFGSAPAFGGNTNAAPAFGGAANGGYGAGSVPPASPANFDFPTVQLPVGSFGASTQPISAAPAAPAAPSTGYPSPDGEDVDPRSRKPSQERMRSPNARRQQGRRVGGRELPGGMEDETETGAYAEERSPEPVPAASAAEPYSGGYNPPPMQPNSLLEEHRSPMGKLLLIGAAVAVVAIALIFFLGKDDEEALPENVPSAAAPAESPVVTPAPEPTAPAAPADPTASAPAAPAAPAAAAPAQPPAAEKPKAEPPAQVAKVEPRAAAPRPVPGKKPPKAEKPRAAVPAAETVEEEPPAQPAAVAPGKLRVTSTPAGAEVLVNFSKKGNTPTEVSLLNNSNKIIVRMPGYKRFETTLPKNHPDRNLDVTLEREEGDEPAAKAPDPRPEPPKAAAKPPPEDEGDAYEDLPMKSEPPKRAEPVARQEPKPRAEAAPTPGDGPIGVIFLSSSPARADIIIDGKNTGKKTPAKVELPSGNHRIEMVKSGQKAVVDQTVNEGKNKALHLTLQ